MQKRKMNEQAFAGGVGLGKGLPKIAVLGTGVTLFQVAGVDFLPPSLPINWLKGVGLLSVEAFNI